jgi:deoxyribodipyrimidine photo-lyase
VNLGLVWFRDDLRLADNPALEAALRSELAPVPIYIHAPDEESRWRPGAASDAWRHRSLAALAADLARLGSRLRIFAGPSAATLAELVAATGAQAVFWNRRYEPAIVERDGRIKRALRRLGVRAESSNAKLLFEPWELATQSGEPYRLFSPSGVPRSSTGSCRRSRNARSRRPRDVPDGVRSTASLAPRPDWDAVWEEWRPARPVRHRRSRRARRVGGCARTRSP